MLLIKYFKVNGINLNLYFKTLQPLEFTEIDSELVDDETQEEETGIKQEDLSTPAELTEEQGNEILEELKISELGDEWEFVDKRDMVNTNEMFSDEDWATICIGAKETRLTRLTPGPTKQRETLLVI